MTMKTSRPASFIKGSLGFRLAGLFSLIFLLLLAGFAYYTAQTQSRLINQRLEAHAGIVDRGGDHLAHHLHPRGVRHAD